MSVALSPSAVRKLRKFWQLADELRRGAAEASRTRRMRLEEREHARRKLRELEDEATDGRGAVTLTSRKSDGAFLDRQRTELHRAIEHERARLQSIEGEIAEIDAREQRDAEHRAHVGNLAEQLIRVSGYDVLKLEGKA